MLAATSKWFLRVVMDESVWKFACLRDLQVPDCSETAFKWINLYASAFGKHRASYYMLYIVCPVDLLVHYD